MKTEQNKQRLFRGFRPDKKGSVTITVNGEKIRGEWEYWNELGKLQVKPVPPRSIGTPPPFSPALASMKKLVRETIGQRVKTDKNGKDIFEGDIVQGYVYIKQERKWALAEAEIKYISDFAQSVLSEYHPVVNCKVYSSCNTTIRTFKEIEVIGNIYENPELLEDHDGEN